MYELHPISHLLEDLFGRVDIALPTSIDFDDIYSSRLSIDDANRLVAAGLLSPGPPPTELLCGECGEYTEIVYIDDYKGEFFPVLPCTENVGSRVDPERMQTWQLTFSQLAESVFKPLGITAAPEELEPNRLWRLGRRTWAGVSWTIYFARELRRRDAMRLLASIRAPARSVVLVSKYLPIEPPEPKTPLILRLVDFVSYEAGGLRVDEAYVAEQLVLRRGELRDEVKSPSRKRSSRMGLIDRLVKILSDHVRAARDHLAATDGAEPLPRLSQRDLAREAGVSEVAVSRCFRDEAGRELRFLWELAADPHLLERATAGRF